MVIGDVRWLEQAASLCQKKVSFRLKQYTTHGARRPGQINLLECPIENIDNIIFGKVLAASGSAYQFIEQAVRHVQQSKKLNRSLPINKLALKAARIPHIGHTEILA